MRFLLLLLLLPFFAKSQSGLPTLGQWREHLPYQSVIAVTASEKKIYAATPLSLFSVDAATADVERFSKVSGLSETGISTLCYDSVSHKLYVAYSNSNLDVLTTNSLRNIPGLKRSTLPGDKNIYALYPDGDRCYLATGLGIVVLDATRYEIRDSWFVGHNGGYVKTTGFLKTPLFFYAATTEGLKRTAVTNSAPADFRTWQTVSGTGGLPLAPAKAVVAFTNKTMVLQNDSLFIEEGTGWRLFFANGRPIASIRAAGQQLLVVQQGNGAAQVLVLNGSGTVQTTLQQPGKITAPEQALLLQGELWIADRSEGLLRVNGQRVESIKPNSPQNIVLGDMVVQNGVLWAAAGTVNSSWNYQYNPSGLFRLEGDWWTAFNRYAYPQLDTVLDWMTIAIDPRNPTAWAGSFGGGLVHLAAGGPVVFKQGSPLGPAVGDPGSYRVAGLAFDGANNLWIANFGAATPLLVRRADSTWQAFAPPFFLNQQALAQIVIDDAGQKWIQAPLGNGLLVFDEGAFDNPADDRWQQFKAGAGQGNLPSNDVLCLAKDKEGQIWVGTTNGVAVFVCAAGTNASGSCEAFLPVIREGAFAAYLFKGQEVRSIAVDGANRKWMATASGVWLLSPEGDKVLENFTETNSPLFSNDVKKIAIDGRTGEVFIATARGLLSFRGSAVEAAETKGSVLVYPNPVPPGFAGTIGIRGLPENSVVKITETNGRLVYQTRSLGGQALWNGRDYRGQKAASGVYWVLAAAPDKEEKMVAKIVFLH